MANVSFNFGSFSVTQRGGSKVPTIAFFVLFLIGAVFLTWAFANDQRSAMRAWRWVRTPCVVVSAAVPHLTKPYTAEISYRYDYAGAAYTSSTLSRDYHGDNDYYPTQKLIDAYPVGGATECRVDPQNPSNAVLRTRSAWTLALLLVPLLFIVMACAGLYLTFFPIRMENGVALRGSGLAVAFCSVFFLAGAATFFFAFLPGLRRSRSIQTWPAAACEIVHSGVENHSGDNGTTYSVEVLYRYQFDGLTHLSSRYASHGVSTSNYDAHKTVAATLAQQKRQTCYVNPDDPDDAVLTRDDDGWAWLTGILSSVFMLVGAGGMGLSVWSKVKRKDPVALPPVQPLIKQR